MNLTQQLEQMKSQGKKVVSIDFLLIELKGIPPTRQQEAYSMPKIHFHSENEQIPVKNK